MDAKHHADPDATRTPAAQPTLEEVEEAAGTIRLFKELWSSGDALEMAKAYIAEESPLREEMQRAMATVQAGIDSLPADAKAELTAIIADIALGATGTAALESLSNDLVAPAWSTPRGTPEAS